MISVTANRLVAKGQSPMTASGSVAIHSRVTKACNELVDALCDFWLDDGFHMGGMTMTTLKQRVAR